MKRLEDDRLLKSIDLSGIHSNSACTDLASLADQLLTIAHELRRDEIDNGITSLERNPTFHITADSDFAAAMATKTANNPQPSVNSTDIRMQRLHHAETARQIYSRRRQRIAIFDNPELFGEPAWDILLDLYVAYAENKQVSVSSACIGSATPPTTGLRWLGVLAENDLILREHDPDDQRRVLVRLTESGLAAMDRFFANTGASA